MEKWKKARRRIKKRCGYCVEKNKQKGYKKFNKLVLFKLFF